MRDTAYEHASRVAIVTVLITGAGNIGCEVAQGLVARGERVVLFDINPSLDRVRLFVDPDQIAIVKGDITDIEQVGHAVDQHGVDRIIHTAAIHIPASQANPQNGIAINLMGATNVLEIARRRKLKRIVLSGSSSVIFGILDDFQAASIPDDFAMQVVSQVPKKIYAAAKLAAEFFAGIYVDEFGVDAVVLRYSSVIRDWSAKDPGLVGAMLRAFVDPPARGERAVIENPDWVWTGLEEFVDARDCADVTIAALLAEHLPQRVYNIGGAGAYQLSEFADIVRHTFPKGEVEISASSKVGLGGAPVRNVRLDMSAAARDFGYRPKYDLSASLTHFSEVARNAEKAK
jgi:UDP-glucose 4-epimerase